MAITRITIWKLIWIELHLFCRDLIQIQRYNNTGPPLRQSPHLHNHTDLTVREQTHTKDKSTSRTDNRPRDSAACSADGRRIGRVAALSRSTRGIYSAVQVAPCVPCHIAPRAHACFPPSAPSRFPACKAKMARVVGTARQRRGRRERQEEPQEHAGAHN